MASSLSSKEDRAAGGPRRTMRGSLLWTMILQTSEESRQGTGEGAPLPATSLEGTRQRERQRASGHQSSATGKKIRSQEIEPLDQDL